MAETITLFGDFRNKLGESPVWDPDAGLLYWIDAVEEIVFAADVDGNPRGQWRMPAPVGSIGLATDGLIAALQDGFYLIKDGTASPIATPEGGEALIRFNDGKADRQGRFLSGTMRIGGGIGADVAPGKLYRLDHDGSTAVLDTGIWIANSTCFSPSGDTLYFADSLQYAVWAYDYDGDTGSASNKRMLLDTRLFGSVPDGATVDADGNIWLALVQVQRIVQIAPDGRLLRAIKTPLPLPSCPAFGGENLDIMFLTSIGNSGHLLETHHPDGGRIMRIEGLGVRGLPEAHWTGKGVQP